MRLQRERALQSKRVDETLDELRGAIEDEMLEQRAQVLPGAGWICTWLSLNPDSGDECVHTEPIIAWLISANGYGEPIVRSEFDSAETLERPHGGAGRIYQPSLCDQAYVWHPDEQPAMSAEIAVKNLREYLKSPQGGGCLDR